MSESYAEVRRCRRRAAVRRWSGRGVAADGGGEGKSRGELCGSEKRAASGEEEGDFDGDAVSEAGGSGEGERRRQQRGCGGSGEGERRRQQRGCGGGGEGEWSRISSWVITQLAWGVPIKAMAQASSSKT